MPRFECDRDDYNAYLSFLVYAVLGDLAQADAVLRTHEAEVRRVASAFKERLGLPRKKLYRGLVLKASSIPKNKRMQANTNATAFSSWSESTDVACWFADKTSSINRMPQMQAPGMSGYVLEGKPPAKDVLFHHSWGERIPFPGRSEGVPLVVLVASVAPMLAEVAIGENSEESIKTQVAWNLKTQEEVIVASHDKLYPVVTAKEFGCPGPGKLDTLAHPWFR